MTTIYEFSTEAQSSAFWHHLLNQMGFDRMMALCAIKMIGGTYTITVHHEA
jgi:hypothetical protein